MAALGSGLIPGSCAKRCLNLVLSFSKQDLDLLPFQPVDEMRSCTGQNFRVNCFIYRLSYAALMTNVIGSLVPAPVITEVQQPPRAPLLAEAVFSAIVLEIFVKLSLNVGMP